MGRKTTSAQWFKRRTLRIFAHLQKTVKTLFLVARIASQFRDSKRDILGVRAFCLACLRKADMAALAGLIPFLDGEIAA